MKQLFVDYVVICDYFFFYFCFNSFCLILFWFYDFDKNCITTWHKAFELELYLRWNFQHQVDWMMVCLMLRLMQSRRSESTRTFSSSFLSLSHVRSWARQHLWYPGAIKREMVEIYQCKCPGSPSEYSDIRYICASRTLKSIKTMPHGKPSLNLCFHLSQMKC